VLEVVLLEEADLLVQVVGRDLELGSDKAQRRIEVRQCDLETAANSIGVDLEIEIAVAGIVGCTYSCGARDDQ
jgi:hypothetical protein